MTDRKRVGIGRSMAVVGVAGGLVGIVWLLLIGVRGSLWDDWIVHNALIAIGTGVIVWLALPSQPKNTAIWVLAWSSVLTGLEVLGYGVLAQSLNNLGIESSLFELVPAELPTWLALVVMQTNWLWMGVLLILAVLHVFPDGECRSRRWRWAFLAMVAVIALTCFGLFWEARPWGTIPIGETQDTNGGFRSVTAALVTLGYPLTFLLGLVGATAMVLQFRDSTGTRRQQFRWMAWGAAIAGVSMVSSLLIDELLGRTDVALVTGAIGLVSLLASFGVAIGKFRLYDIDAVISRTFVYGALAVFIGAVYVGIVVGLGALFDVGGETNTWLGIMATVIIAIAFQPLRRQLQHFANRIVYGRRATPYEVLSSFSQGVSVVDPDVLNQVARSLTEGTTASRAAIWMQRDDEEQLIAEWSESALDASELQSAPISHDGQQLGSVTLDVQAGQLFPEHDRVLLEQVAAGLGLGLRNLLLTEDLRARVDELAASRRRIVSIQDQTRRQLERDLHDGAQQRLVALKIKLGLGANMADKGGYQDLKAVLDTIKGETDGTIESVRDFARGIYPPLLEAEGLEAALSGQARRMHFPVSIDAQGLGRYSKEQEATVYFSVLEALQNALKYSEATSVEVRLRENQGWLAFEVSDDGVGFDVASVAGNGLLNMRDRVEAVDGSLAVESQVGRGTAIAGKMPVAAEVLA